jgi:hypothetical protein
MFNKGNADAANVAKLKELMARYRSPEAVSAAMDKEMGNLPVRVAGARLRDLRLSLQSSDGRAARSADPRLQALLDLFYQQMLPPTQ